MVNVGLFIEFFCGTLLTGMMIAIFNKKNLELFELFAVSLSLFLVDSCLISVILLLLKSFTPVLALSLSSALPLLIIIATLRDNPANILKNPIVSKDSLIIALFLMLLLPFVYQHYEFIEQNGDAGAYSVSAMSILKSGRLFVDLDVRSNLSDEKKALFDTDNLLFRKSVSFAGSYYPGTYLTQASDKFYFQFYPAWPVMMSLWGGIFGIENQHFVMVILYMSLVFLFYYMLKHFYPHVFLAMAITMVFGSSPLLIHFTKYPTSELFLLFLVIFVCYNLSKNSLYHAVCAGAGALLYLLSHVSGFVYLPLIFLVLPFAYLEKNGNLLLFGIIAFVGFMLSIPYGYYVSKQYFVDIYRDNFELLFRHNSFKYGMYSVALASLVGISVSFILLGLLKRERAPKVS